MAAFRVKLIEPKDYKLKQELYKITMAPKLMFIGKGYANLDSIEMKNFFDQDILWHATLDVINLHILEWKYERRKGKCKGLT